MATKAINLKLDEADVLDVRSVASVFNMTVTDVVRKAVREYVDRMKNDPFYRLTVHVREASAEESAEILSELEALSDDDLSIASSERFTV